MEKRASKSRKTSSKKQPISRSHSRSKNYKVDKKAIEEAIKKQNRNNWLWIIIILGILVLTFIALVGFESSLSGNAINGQVTAAISPVSNGAFTSWSSLISTQPLLSGAFTYIFGAPISAASFGISDASSAIITIAAWLLLFVTFSDIIATFSSFTKWIAWVMGLLIAVIAANFGFVVSIMAWATAIFSALGAVAVYVGLGAAFVAFIAVNFGLQGLSRWIIRRKAMMIANKEAAGGEKLAGTIRGLGAAGRELRKLGDN